jgi:YVTN family beta-propeller protein
MTQAKGLIRIIFIGITMLAAVFCSRQALAQSAYVNFEGSQTNPVRLSPDGTRLFAVNTPDARLSVFDLADPSNPRLLAEIPVGIEPVSVNARSNDEVWVVNQVSDSVSVVSVSRRIVVDTISVKDEPADVIFAGNRAFVTASRSNQVKVFDAATHALLATIPLLGENPRALAVSPDGTKIYAAFALSGNRTTIIPESLAPPPPSPTNPSLPSAPSQGIIVDAADPAWSSVVQYTMPDNDVVEIDAATLAVTRYFPRVGTVNLALAVSPTTGDLYVANTEARNLIRFEPNVRGRFVDNRISRISVASGAVTPVDLNPTIDYSILPNPTARAIALAQPTAVVFDPSGNFLYVAAFGTDRVARIDNLGNVLSRIEVGPAGATVDPRNKRGPRGLALHAPAQRLYVLNRISNTLSVVDTASETVLSERPVGSFDPTPPAIRNGRGFLYDAKLSGSGTGACAGCHIDSDMDLIAWDLGNPNGVLQTVEQGFFSFQMHPMKGPMTTQTLRGLKGLDPLHWRGDRADFLAFNPAFDGLMGGSPLSDTDMIAYRDFINTIVFQPNPHQNLDRTLPATLAGGDPNAGRNTFVNEFFTTGIACNTCHTITAQGTNRLIISGNALEEPQAFKVPHLRNLYQKMNFDKRPGATSIGGFGFIHDGSIGTLFEFLSLPVFRNFSNDTVRKTNLSAFLLTFDTGMAPAVGYARTVTPSNVSDSAVLSDWVLLEGQAAAGNIDLIVKGTIDGQARGLLYQPASNSYRADQSGVGPFTRAQLIGKIAAGDLLTPMGVPVGSGVRMGIDRDLNGVLDQDSAAPPPPVQTVMHVADIKTTDGSGNSKTIFTRGETIFWRVKIVDQNNHPVGGASVKTRIFLFGTAVFSATSTTGADGWALFSRPTGRGDLRAIYTLRVNSVSKEGATYDSSANVRSSTTFALR